MPRVLNAWVLGLISLGLAVCFSSSAKADTLVDVRASFRAIEPYTAPPSPPVAKEFSVPGPGTLRVTTILSPWFRSSTPVQFRSIPPIDGRDEGAWAVRFPGAEAISATSDPERWVDGSGLTLVTEYRVTKALPRLQVGLFPSTVRFGDGSVQQLANSVQVIIVFIPAAGAASSDGPATTASGPGCGWINGYDNRVPNDLGRGITDLNEHRTYIRNQGPGAVPGLFSSRLEALRGCLPNDTYARLYADVSLIIADYGRRYAGWTDSMDSRGGADPGRGLSNWQSHYAHVANYGGAPSVPGLVAQRMSDIDRVISNEVAGELYAQVTVVIARYGLGR